MDEGDAISDPLFNAVGRALSNWQNIENQLANLFTLFVGADISAEAPGSAVGAYGAIVGFKNRLSMVDAASDAYFRARPTGEGRKQWKDLRNLLSAFSQRRNDIAHGAVERELDARPEVAVRGFFLFPGLYGSKKNPMGQPPAYKLTAAQVRQFADQFAELKQDVHNYRFMLQTKAGWIA